MIFQINKIIKNTGFRYSYNYWVIPILNSKQKTQHDF